MLHRNYTRLAILRVWNEPCSGPNLNILSNSRQEPKVYPSSEFSDEICGKYPWMSISLDKLSGLISHRVLGRIRLSSSPFPCIQRKRKLIEID